jgi:transcriptional regulator with XRE-family HTH domain
METNLRQILAVNIKENRRRCGYSQVDLAKKAGISTPFLAMIEVSRKFPTPDVLDRLAEALNIRTYQLFAVAPSPAEAMERLQQSIIQNINFVVEEAVEKALAKKVSNEQ